MEIKDTDTADLVAAKIMSKLKGKTYDFIEAIAKSLLERIGCECTVPKDYPDETELNLRHHKS